MSYHKTVVDDEEFEELVESLKPGATADYSGLAEFVLECLPTGIGTHSVQDQIWLEEVLKNYHANIKGRTKIS